MCKNSYLLALGVRTGTWPWGAVVGEAHAILGVPVGLLRRYIGEVAPVAHGWAP